MKEILNYNMPDDGHYGLETEGIRIEAGEKNYILTKTRFEYFASSLIRMLDVDDMAMRLTAEECDDYDGLPDERIAKYSSAATRRKFRAYVANHEADFTEIRQRLLDELHQLFDELWSQVKNGERINHCCLGQYYRVFFDNTDGTVPDINHLEVIGPTPNELVDYYRASLMWDECTGSTMWD